MATMSAVASKVDRNRSSGAGSVTAGGMRNGRGTDSARELLRARIHPPRIADVDERIANVERATKRIKTDVQVDFVRTRRGRR
jgi:hypothetical protein